MEFPCSIQLEMTLTLCYTWQVWGEDQQALQWITIRLQDCDVSHSPASQQSTLKVPDKEA